MKNFLEIDKSQWIYEDSFFFIIKDKYPVNPGHLLIISKRIVETYFQLNLSEKTQLLKMIDTAKSIIDNNYSPSGYNIGMNCGKASGQTIYHFHCHIIPRYTGDIDNPEGGVRGVIPEKRIYK